MEIRHVTIGTCEKAILPALSFGVEIAQTKLQEAIIGVEGFLESDDGKMLANVVKIAPEQPRISEIGARDSNRDSEFKETIHSLTLIASLDKNSLNYIEKRRLENIKGDIFLTLNLNVQSIVTKAKISHFHEINPEGTPIPSEVNVFSASGRREKGKILAYGHDSQFASSYSNLWIISGDGGPVFLSVNEQGIKKEGLRIPSVDWIHDFAPKLGLGEYFVVEIPKGNDVAKQAWDYVNKGEECYRQWDPKGAYANCREVRTILNAEIGKKFANTPTIKKWNRAVATFEKLASLGLHEEDVKEEQPKGEVSIGRPEVEHILIVTKALIKYAGELLQEKS